VWQIKYPLKLFAIFSAMAQNLNAEFCTLITSSYPHKKPSEEITDAVEEKI